MRKVRYQALGPLLSGEGSRAFLGLEISEDNRAKPIVLIWAPTEAATNPELRERLTKETARAAALQHPNIVRVYGLAAVDEGLARIVEFADGESLRKVLDRTGTLPPRFAAFVAAEAAAGVHFAHLTGNEDGTPLVHGDIRPETILVSFKGYAKVSGYGALTVAPRELGGNRVMGRRAHCAPEQILGGREAAIRETDIYLLGILLYESLTGMIPFGEEADFDKAVVNQPLRLNHDAIPPYLVDIIARATVKRASDRFPTALAFREMIEQAVGGLPTHEEFAAYLKDFFPENDEARAARRRELDGGIADLARKQWARSAQQQPPLGGEALGGPAPASSVYLDAIPASAGTPRAAPPLGGEPLAGSAHPSSVYLEAIPASVATQRAPPPPPGRAPLPGSAHPSSVYLEAIPASVATQRAAPPPASPPPAARPPPSPPPPTATPTPAAHAQHRVDAATPPAPPPAPAVPVVVQVAPPAQSARSWLLPALVGASLALGAAGVLWGMSQSGRPVTPPPGPVAPPSPPLTAPAPQAAVAPAPAAPAPQPAQPVPAAPAQPAPTLPPEPVATVTPPEPSEPPAPPEPPKPPEPPSLELSVTPAVDVTIDGKRVGRSPISIPIPPGKHKLSLRDGAKGINLTRSITVGKTGKTRQSITVGKGSVIVTAPPGAVIYMDGKKVGTAPVPEIPVYEGAHRIMVTMGKARWQQPFSLRDGENMTFNVETTGGP